MCALIWLAFIRGDGDGPEWYHVYGSRKDCELEMEEVNGYTRVGAVVDKKDSLLCGYTGPDMVLGEGEYVLVKACSMYYGA